jgi:hypothetical protein
LASAVAGYALVNVSPDQTYVAELGGNGNNAVVFGGVKVSGGAPNTQTGLSGQGLDGSVITTSDAQFQVIGLAPQEYIVTPRSSAAASAAAPVLVECIIINPALGNFIV